MSYENAPATKMLATNCACCAKPLVDSVSVETGVGPECRAKHGYSDGPTEHQADANAIVHLIACKQSGKAVVDAVNELRRLGFKRLARRIAFRLATVRIEEEGSELVVKTPYKPESVVDFRNIPGRHYDREKKVNRVPMQPKSKAALFATLQKHFAGCLAYGPKGLFVVGA
jgi:hypothetical protein